MARARLLKPGFWANEDLAALPPHARLLYAGLWGLADRAGRLEDRPVRIRAALFPYDAPPVNVDDLLNRLADAGFIERYAVDGARYIAIPTFLKHQRPHLREAGSVIPQPPAPTKAVPRTDLGECEHLPRSPVTGDGDPEALSKSVIKTVDGEGKGDRGRGNRAARGAENDERHVKIAEEAIAEHGTETTEQDELIDIVQWFGRTKNHELTKQETVKAIQAVFDRRRLA